MAHSWHGGPRYLAVLYAIPVALAAYDAGAIVLGEPEVRSALGEILDLRIPVMIGKGESIEPSCFSLAREPQSGVPRLTTGRFSLERSAQGTYLRIRTDSSINEPALTLGVVASCPGQFAHVQRDYSVLVDPRTVAESPASELRIAPSAQAAGTAAGASTFVPSIAATLIARIGDTLESIANAIFPRNRAAKKSYIEALRETNPPLATLGDRDPIPLDTAIALPDLRTFAKARPSREGEGASPLAKAARESRRTSKARQDSGETRPAAPRLERLSRPSVEPRPATRREDAVDVKTPPVRSQPGPGFVLKLSSAQVDLARSRAIDDRMRAQLRDRQLVLDADDQVAAVLALRNSVRQLETRVAELQLKLAGMPSTFPPPKAAPEPAPVSPPAQTPSSPPPIAASPVPPPDALSSAAPPVSTSAPPTPVPPGPEPAQSPDTSLEKAQPTPAAKSPPPAARKVADPAAAKTDWLYYGLWALALLFVLAAIVLATRLARRRRDAADEYAQEPADDQIVVAEEPLRQDPVFAREPVTPPPRASGRAADAEGDARTRVADNSTDDLRRRYIEERFPEIVKGAISFENPDSVVKGARLFYEDGAIARAVELLHYAIERRPEELKTWLALFEIFRLERLTGEFAELARRFREHHGKSDSWRKVQYFGREIDAENELYAEASSSTFEPSRSGQSKRLAADAGFDPVTENWLGAPMDFQNEVLANELRKALMAQAGIKDEDLVANPMPALRNIEMFNVA